MDGNTGVVKFFDAKKGYGFITPDNGEKDVFVHYSGIDKEGYKTLEVGDMVTYTIKEDHRGKSAVNVKNVK